MFWALFNDLMQRLISLNKIEQRTYLQERVDAFSPEGKCKVLDFGCGTGLFNCVFDPSRFTYVGYDIDGKRVDYARWLYGKSGTFTSSIDEVAEKSPFDLIVANFCFHHIDDAQLHVELDRFKQMIHNDKGAVLLIDLCRISYRVNWLHRVLLSLERGQHLRSVEEYADLVGKHFKIDKLNRIRMHPFSFRNSVAYYDAVFCACSSSK